MRLDKDCIGVGMQLRYVSGNDSSSDNDMSVMWRWDGIMIALGSAWGWDMC